MILPEDILLATERIAALSLQRLSRVDLFKALLAEFTSITKSKDGFVGEVLRDENGLLYIKAFALTALAWEASLGSPDEAELAQGVELHQMSSPWGSVLKSGKVFIKNEPDLTVQNFLGFPLKVQGRWEGIICVANSDQNYQREWADALLPMRVASQLVIMQERECRRVAESEKRLVDKVRRTEEALKAAHAGALEWDVLADVVHCDEGITELFSIERREYQLSLNGWLEYLQTKDRPEVYRRIKALVAPLPVSIAPALVVPEAMKKNADRLRMDLKIVKKSGDSYIRMSLVVERDANKKAIKVRGMCWDVTEQKQVESQLADNRTRMTSASRLSSLGEMAGGVAHEVNNPLAIIHANSMMLKEQLLEGVPATELVRFVDKVIKTTDRIARIIKGLRTFSRNADDDPFVQVSVQELVEVALDFCRAKLSAAGIELQVQIPDGLASVCRGVQISQALLGMINNSADAIEGLEVRWIKIEAKEVDSPDGSEMVEISVTDAGSGISDAIADKIMQPFFTTKEIGKGTGLSLSVARGIAESHNGELLLDRECPNTRFVIRIPKQVAAAAA